MLVTLPASAHDFWIDAEPFTAQIDTDIELHLRIGEQLGGDSLPWVPNWYSNTHILSPGKNIAADEGWPGITGDVPAGKLSAREDGVHVIAVQTYRDFVELDAVKFNTYLKKEGLERILREREQAGASETPGTEFYTRCAKALVNVGQGNNASRIKQELGMTLEIVPLGNPYEMKPGDSLPIQVLYLSKPIEGLTVIAFNNDQPEERRKIITDKNGKALIPLNSKGIWLLQSIQMIPVEQPSRADWESFWASLTFEL